MTELFMLALFLLFWVMAESLLQKTNSPLKEGYPTAVIGFIVFLFSIHWSIGILAVFILIAKLF